MHVMVAERDRRFVLKFELKDEAVAAAKAASEGFKSSWQAIATAVWDRFVAHAEPLGNGTRERWGRQVESFWEVNWVVGQASDNDPTIARLDTARKQFRNTFAIEQEGVKCSLMPNYQELSGHRAYPRDDMQRFWASLQEHAGDLDLGDSERLCAIALIKRLFPKVSQKAIGVNLEDSRAWPSTAFLAATPWLKKLTGEAEVKAKEFARQAENARVGRSEFNAATEAGISWAKIDAPVWFKNSLNRNEWEVDATALGQLTKQLTELYEVASKSPIPCYAILMMDGDRMGRLLQQLGAPEKLSQCLGEFTSSVEAIVTEHDGRTVYAGGDDVLALLPAEDALPVATKLSERYRESFAVHSASDVATISAAIVFVHWRQPMRQMLKLAHHLLDDVAKTATGRDALAIGIVQGSGLNALWAAPWKVVRGEARDCHALADILPLFGSNDHDSEREKLNASFLYHLREQFSRLFAKPLEMPGTFGEVAIDTAVDSKLFSELANAEYRRRLTRSERKKRTPEETRRQLEPIMSLSRQATNKDNGTQEVNLKSFGFDGWRVARFLKQINDGKVGSNDE